MQCPVCLPPPKKNHPGSQKPALALFPTLAQAPARENSFFYIFRGRRGMRRARFSPVGRGRGESRDAMARLGLGSADTCCCSWRFIIAQTAPLLSGLGLRPAAPCPEGCEGGGGAWGKGGEEKWRRCPPRNAHWCCWRLFLRCLLARSVLSCHWEWDVPPQAPTRRAPPPPAPIILGHLWVTVQI